MGWHDTVEKLVALVASLKSAADFTAALTATLTVLEQLLASSAAAEVQVRRAAEAGSPAGPARPMACLASCCFV